MENTINIREEEFRLHRQREQVKRDYDEEVKLLQADLHTAVLKLKKKRDDKLQELAAEEGRVVMAYQKQKARMMAELQEGGDQ